MQPYSGPAHLPAAASVLGSLPLLHRALRRRRTISTRHSRSRPNPGAITINWTTVIYTSMDFNLSFHLNLFVTCTFYFSCALCAAVYNFTVYVHEYTYVHISTYTLGSTVSVRSFWPVLVLYICILVCAGRQVFSHSGYRYDEAL